MAEEQAQSAAEQQFGIQRIYIRDVSFESPMGASVFKGQFSPQIKVDLNTGHEEVGEDIYEVVLSVTVTASLEDKVAFLIEVQQAGLFHIGGFEGEQLRQVLAMACPNVLFPYAREAIDDLAVRGTFPPLMLQPVNFEALYRQAVEQQAQKVN